MVSNGWTQFSFCLRFYGHLTQNEGKTKQEILVHTCLDIVQSYFSWGRCVTEALLNYHNMLLTNSQSKTLHKQIWCRLTATKSQDSVLNAHLSWGREGSESHQSGIYSCAWPKWLNQSNHLARQWQNMPRTFNESNYDREITCPLVLSRQRNLFHPFKWHNQLIKVTD